jgi:hypothetical protein
MSLERQRRRASEASVADKDDWIAPANGPSPARGGGPAPAVFTIPEFCAAHRLSRSKLYQLWAAGAGPRKMSLGTKILISVEAAADWRREREAASACSGDNQLIMDM